MTTQVETTDSSDIKVDDKPSGPAAAAFIATGIGSLVMGLMVNVNELSGRIKDATGFDASAFLQFDKNFGLGAGVGPLSGKVIITVLAFAISWVVLFFAWRHREIGIRKTFIWTIVLVGLGFALTFPPIFLLLAGG
jgi:hypothetical protein